MNIFEGLFQLFIFNFETFIIIFNSIPIEITWFIFLIISFSTVLIFLKFFGEAGLYVYTTVAIIAANIQVLKIVKFQSLYYMFEFCQLILH